MSDIMAKKLILGILAAASLFAVSCAKESAPATEAGKEVTVSFMLETPVISTRSYSDGATATVLQYAVYDAAGNELVDLTKTAEEIHGKTAVELQLTTGNTYSMIFWAAAEDAPYTVDFSKKTMTVDYNAAECNDENRDAFYKYVEPFEVTGAVSKIVELKRPFAQLNIGTNDYEASASAGYVPTRSYVKVPVYSELNLVDGTVAVETEVEFGFADLDRSQAFPVAGYEYLAMNYLLVAADKETIEVEFSYTDGTTKKTRTVGSVPVQRNHRTNIFGQLLTSDLDINVELKPGFDDDDYEINLIGGTMSDPEKLEETMASINAGVQENPVVNIPAGAYVSWTTGGGHGSTPLVSADNDVTETVTFQGAGESSVLVVDGSGVGSLRAANGGKLIFKDLTIVDNSVSYNESAWEFTYLELAGALEFENVTFKGGITLQAESDGTQLDATFKNCTFITEEDSVYGVWVSDGTSSFTNCKFQGTRGLKMHEDYGSEIAEVMIDACEFGPLSKKPGVAIGDLNASTVVTIQNSSFIGCQAGDQGKYIYETDTDVTAFTFVLKNNSIEEDPANVVKIASKADLIAFQNEVNVEGNSYAGKTIQLAADIDLEGMTWEPVGQTGGNGVATYFQGAFDGKGYTISNFKVVPNANYGEGANYAAGLFGFIDAGEAVVKNLNVDKATVEGHHWSAVIAGYLTGTIQNCHVTNSSVTCTHANGDACGDKAGVIVGYINSGSVKDCSAKNCTVTAGRDAGQIVGCNSASGTVTGCSATNVTVSATGDCTGANIKNDLIGRQN